MDKTKIPTFIMTHDANGQKIYTSKADKTKRYTIDDHGNMIRYKPPTIQYNIQVPLEDEEFEDYDTEDETQDEGPTLGGISIGSLECATDFDDHLMQELDSDLIGSGGTSINELSSNGSNNFIMQHMDIREPLSKLKHLLEVRLGLGLSDYVFYLQGTQMLENNKTLVEQCVQGQGLVQINIQLQATLKRINILDVLKPAEDYIHVENNLTTPPPTTHIVDTEENSRKEPQPQHKAVVQWQVDLAYKKEQDRLRIPHDPIDWAPIHVRHWVQWAVRQFNLPNIKLSDWSMSGRQLHEVTVADFQKIVPNDPGDIFWTHLELLRKMKVVAIKKDDMTDEPPKVPPPLTNISTTNNKAKAKVNRVINNFTSNVTYFDSGSSSTTSNHSGGKSGGNNGQIQLWQFLLELLTTKDYRQVIHWTGNEGEFKLHNPQIVAQLWGERKNKPAMNYEKLSRALRYYYDGDMISKVHGERFVYKFVCDLKELLGYNSRELMNLINHGRAFI